MPNVGPLELVFLGLLAVLIFGPAKLPEIGRGIGRATREFREAITGTGIDEAVSGVNDVRKAVNPANLAKAAVPAPVKEMASGVTEMKETFTDPLGLKKKEQAESEDGDEADGEAGAEKPAAEAPPPAATTPSAPAPEPTVAP
jgi:TatA/E family protein of Tat protein translocase